MTDFMKALFLLLEFDGICSFGALVLLKFLN